MIYIDSLPYREGVIGYILNDLGEILVFQSPDYKDNEWRLPGGGLNEGEDPKRGIVRELLEEFGTEEFDVLWQSPHIHQFEWPEEFVLRSIARGKGFRGQRQHQVVLRYLGKASEISVQPQEVRQYCWIKEEDLIQHLVFPGQLEMAQKVLAEFHGKI